MFNAIISVIVIQKVLETQWNRREYLPQRVEKAFVGDWSDRRIISRVLHCGNAWSTWRRKVACTLGV